MKLKKIVDALPSLQKLAAADLTLRQLYYVKKLVAALQPEFTFWDEKRKSIVDKYRDGNIIPAENREAANKEIQELIDFDVKVKYKEVILPDSEGIKLSLNDLEALEGFVKINFTEENE